MSKIYVRQRRHVAEGAGQPRFAIVAVAGVDLDFYREFLRRAELEAIAKDVGAAAVLIAAVVAVVVGLIILGPPLLQKLGWGGF